MNQHYYVEVEAGEAGFDKDKLAAALRASGVEVKLVEETCGEHNGVIYTDEALDQIWFLESEYEYCSTEGAEGRPGHKEWTDLSDDQRDHFIKQLTDWTGDQRYDHFYLDEHDKEGVFDGVAVSCAQHADNRKPVGKGDQHGSTASAEGETLKSPTRSKVYFQRTGLTPASGANSLSLPGLEQADVDTSH